MEQKTNRKCNYFLIFCLLLFLFQGTAYASASPDGGNGSESPDSNGSASISPDSGNSGTGSLTVTDENRFDPRFYQQPQERYPISNSILTLCPLFFCII